MAYEADFHTQQCIFTSLHPESCLIRYDSVKHAKTSSVLCENGRLPRDWLCSGELDHEVQVGRRYTISFSPFFLFSFPSLLPPHPHILQGLAQAMYPRMTSSFCFSCLYHPSASITDMGHHPCFCAVQNQTQSIPHARLILCQWRYFLQVSLTRSLEGTVKLWIIFLSASYPAGISHWLPWTRKPCHRCSVSYSGTTVPAPEGEAEPDNTCVYF